MRFALSSSVFNGGRDTGSCTANHPSSNFEASGAPLSTILPRRRKVASLSSLIPLFAQVRQYVQQRAGRIAIIDANGRFGYDDLLAASARVAAALLAGREDLLEETTAPVHADIAAIHNAIAATCQLLQLFRLQLHDDKSRKLRRLSQRILNLSHELDSLANHNNGGSGGRIFPTDSIYVAECREPMEIPIQSYESQCDPLAH